MRSGIFLLAVAALAQSQTFEVASIKPSGPQSQRGSDGGPGSSDPGRYSFNRATLLDLIAIAYHVEYFQISSKMALDGQAFDLTAKLPAGATREQFRTMLQNLLAERFHLQQHIESREFPGYELAVAKTGPKLDGRAAAQSAEGFPDLPADRPGMISRHTTQDGYLLVRMRARQEPMSVFANWLQIGDDRPVIDKTGLPGKYDFTFEYSRQLPHSTADAAEPAGVPDLFTALQQQLGLQLVARKIPLPVVVVESVDRIPTEN